MGLFDTMLTSLMQMDFFQVLFPFLLALAIFYGVFKKFLEPNIGKGPTGLISIVLSFFVMLYAKQIPGLSAFITWGSGSTLAIAVMILFIIVIFGLFGLNLADIKDKKNWVGFLIVLVAIFAILSVMGGIPGLGFNFAIPGFTGNMDIWAIVIFVVIVAISWHFLSGGGGDAAKPAEKK